MLLSLPAELQQKIVDSIDPWDIVAFASTCKHAQAISLTRLQEYRSHAGFIREHAPSLSPANIRLPATAASCLDSGGSPGLLLAIAETPRLALFLRDLDSKWQPWSDKWIAATPENVWRSMRQLANESPILRNESEVHDWSEAVINGRGGAALGLLLSRLTHLKKIQVNVGYKDSVIPYVARAISRLAAKSQSGFLEQGLSQLEVARFIFIDDSGSDNPPYVEVSDDEEQQREEPVVIAEDHFHQALRLLASLAQLPKLQHLSVMNNVSPPRTADRDAIIDWIDANDPEYPLPKTSSQLRCLTVDRGTISSHALSRIIGHCTRLSSFRYIILHNHLIFGRYWKNIPAIDPVPHMTLESICASLLKHAKSSLRCLHLEISNYGGMCGCRHEPCLKPFGGVYLSINPCAPQTTNWQWNEFANLQRLTLDIDLFSNAAGGWLPFAETLPRSIKEVTILAYRCPPGANKLDFENMLRGFKPQDFPNLSSINSWQRNANHFMEIGHNGPDHIIQVYNLALQEANVPVDAIQQFELGNEYFQQKRNEQLERERRTRSNRMEMFGIKDDELYALPEKDLEGRVVFGVYYATGLNSLDWQNLYIGLAVTKTWA